MDQVSIPPISSNLEGSTDLNKFCTLKLTPELNVFLIFKIIGNPSETVNLIIKLYDRPTLITLQRQWFSKVSWIKKAHLVDKNIECITQTVKNLQE